MFKKSNKRILKKEAKREILEKEGFKIAFGISIIALSIIALGGEFTEKIPGEGTLAAKTLLKGTKQYSAQELAQITGMSMEEASVIIENWSQYYY